jgi:hypothetical protein
MAGPSCCNAGDHRALRSRLVLDGRRLVRHEIVVARLIASVRAHGAELPSVDAHRRVPGHFVQLRRPAPPGFRGTWADTFDRQSEVILDETTLRKARTIRCEPGVMGHDYLSV